MKRNIKLLSIDLDGTLLTSAGRVDEESVKLLWRCKEHGMAIVFNTARPLKIIPKEIYSIFFDDYWIFSNGTTCMKGYEMIFHIDMHKPSADKLIRIVHHEYSSFFFSMESQGDIYTSHSRSQMCRKYFANSIQLEELVAKPTNKILIISEERNFPIQKIRSNVGPDIRELITDSGKYIQFMPRGVSKLSAIQHILELLNIHIGEVLAFGDDSNDLELIKASGIGVAMGNANMQVKRYADYVTTSNDDKGVVLFLEHLLSEKELLIY